MNVSLSQLVSVERFAAAIASGHISERTHENDSMLRVYSYTPKTQYSGHWTPETRLARGLILRVTETLEDAVIVGRGLPKFFTIEQTDSDWGRPKLVDDDENVVVQEAAVVSWDAEAFVAEKLNGALGLAYEAPEGLAISTKGSFGSTEAKIATRIIREKLTDEEQLEFLKIFSGSTALFEIITPERPHPVDYGELEDVIFLGSVEHSTGRWTPAEESHALTKYGFSVAPRAEHTTLRDAVEAPYRENTEGLVVTIQTIEGQELYKVKPAEYLEIRRAFYALEAVDIAELVLALPPEELEHIGYNEIPLPKGVRNEKLHRDNIQRDILVPLRARISEARAAYLELRGEGELPERGEFARRVNKLTNNGAPYFSSYKDELSGGATLVSLLLRELVKELKRAKVNS